MKVTLLHNTPLHINAVGARTCWDSHSKSDTGLFTEICGENDKALIDRVGNKFKHASVLEHVSYNFYVEGISRACLQELARHRMASLSVKSTRYTLKELKEDVTYFWFDDPKDCDYESAKKYIVMTGNNVVDSSNVYALHTLQRVLRDGTSNDIAKYCLPEAYKTELTWTINMRSLQNFLSLRSDKSALWEIRNLANAIYESLPEDHKYMYESHFKIYGIDVIVGTEQDHLNNLRLLAEANKPSREVREKYFNETGTISSDDEINTWWILKQAEEFTKYM